MSTPTTPHDTLTRLRHTRLESLRRAWDNTPTGAELDGAGVPPTGAADGGAAGVWCLMPSPLSAELLARAGFDYLCIDTQHGLARGAALGQVMQVLRHSPTAVLVRVPALADDPIGRALDLGADGVIVPMIRSAADAAAAVAAAKYPPAGHRSWGPSWGDIDGGVASPPQANAATLVAVMIETAQALADIDAIAACPGLDALYVGPNDLALALGLGSLGAQWHPELIAAIQRIAAAARAHGKPLGLHCTGPAQAHGWRGHGVTWFTIATDTALLRSATAGALAPFRAQAGA